jgi:hypothetical protein
MDCSFVITKLLNITSLILLYSRKEFFKESQKGVNNVNGIFALCKLSKSCPKQGF